MTVTSNTSSWSPSIDGSAPRLSAPTADAAKHAVVRPCARDHRRPVAAEAHRELAEERLAATGCDAVDRHEFVEEVVRALRATRRDLAQPCVPSQPSWIAAVTAISVWLVQTLDVAFSRRMSCSRARSVVTNARRSLESTVSPTMRPGRRRTWSSLQAKSPRYGPPKDERRAEGLALADEDVSAPLPGGLQNAGGDGVGAHDEERAVRESASALRRACPRARPDSSDSRHDRGRARRVDARPVRHAVAQGHLDDLVARAAREGRGDLAPVRMNAGGDHHLLAIGRAVGHVERFDECRSPRRRATRWESAVR